jgi:hypothetical protein
MPVLKSLSFTAMPKSASDPVHIRRAKFIEKLEEQKLLLQDPGYVRTVQRTAEVDGHDLTGLFWTKRCERMGLAKELFRCRRSGLARSKLS